MDANFSPTECESGWYGESCKNLCSINCKNTTCNPMTGHCEIGCVSGWTGPFCSRGNCSFPALWHVVKEQMENGAFIFCDITL